VGTTAGWEHGEVSEWAKQNNVTVGTSEMREEREGESTRWMWGCQTSSERT